MSATESRTANLQRAIDRVCQHTRLTRSLVAILLAEFARQGWTLVETDRLAELALRATPQKGGESVITITGMPEQQPVTHGELNGSTGGSTGWSRWWQRGRQRHLRAVDD